MQDSNEIRGFKEVREVSASNIIIHTHGSWSAISLIIKSTVSSVMKNLTFLEKKYDDIKSSSGSKANIGLFKCR